jgi:type VI protein secretion system component VasF
MEHTPGPWRIEEDESGLYIRMDELGDCDEYLAIYASPNPEQRQADARLIAAAPSLLAALEEVLDSIAQYAPMEVLESMVHEIADAQKVINIARAS